MNNVSLIGRPTTDIELKTTQSGVSVVSFSLAVDRKYTPKGQERQTDFIDCVAWRGTAEFLSKWFHKGEMLAVDGEIQTRTYTDKNGNKRKAVEVVIDNAYFCGSKNNSKPSAQPSAEFASAMGGESFEEIIADEDLPF